MLSTPSAGRRASWSAMYFLLFGLVALFGCGEAIQCYRCNSTQTLECLEKFIRPSSLRPASCSDVSEARYCIKTTGIYKDEVGTQRFCSDLDMGNYCENVKRASDGKEFRSCVYTCSTDGCNAATAVRLAPLLLAAIFLLSLLC